ncbi:unnamed protein product [Onchocerca flexuosa]|uniref:Uncharacterized protein n=1 Tax=Onchocerca flexuosa TaxID=387005 RepID=A0A183I650_9BILA|nr:unnamed protein product [Onchocerca flexuosa]
MRRRRPGKNEGAGDRKELRPWECENGKHDATISSPILSSIHPPSISSFLLPFLLLSYVQKCLNPVFCSSHFS